VKARTSNKPKGRAGALPFRTAFLCLAFSLPSAALAFDASAEPARLKPGDPFVVRVRSNPHAPEAVPAGPGVSALNFASCGEGCYVAVGAVDLAAAPGRLAITVKAGAEERSLALNVDRGAFPVQRLTLPREMAAPPPEVQARIEREARMLEEIFGRVSERLWEGPFAMPLNNGFSTGFGVRRVINGKPASQHRGVDIRGAEGTPVHAANRGVAVFAGETYFGGNTLVLDHGAGVFTVYMHLSKISVSERELVGKGGLVGLVGSTGRSTGPHLHYGVKVGGSTANPVAMSGLGL
jgi:hypothetical protein